MLYDGPITAEDPMASAPKTCPRCGSERIIPDAKVEDRAEHVRHELELLVGFNQPDSLIFNEPLRADVRAAICGACGHVELFVPEAEELWKAWSALPEQKPPE